MLALWMAYAVVVSALLGLGALAGERALGAHGRQVRWVWMAALVGSVAIPIGVFLAPQPLTVLSGPVADALPMLSTRGWTASPGDATSPGSDAGASAVRVASTIATALTWAWALGTVLFIGYLAGAYATLRREMREWRPRRVLDAPVLVSEGRGPAVVGFVRSAIVIPAWLLELDEVLVRAVFRHEREHERAGDHRLYGLGVALLAATPWNPVTWWLVARLRLAIEFDCDRRVLDGGVARREYADALIAVGTRASDGWLPTAAFADRKTGVERRLRRVVEPITEFRRRRTISASGLAALAIILVLGAPPPNGAPAGADGEQSLEGMPGEASPWLPPQRPEALSSTRPSFLPYDRPPALRNIEEVRDRLNRFYPAALRDDGIEGRVELWLYIDQAGEVERFVTKTSSGVARLDEAAGEVAMTMRFSPAVNRDRPTSVWVSQWLTFTTAPGSQ